MTNTIVDIRVYSNWYDFKKELQARTGVFILNEEWLKIKPKTALPWSELEMKDAVKVTLG
jgi:hypothetical protein